MKLYIKQNFFSVDGSSKVLDINGAEKYCCEAESVYPGRKVHLYDLSGKEISVVEERYSDMVKEYFIHIDGKTATQVDERFSLFKEKYQAEGFGWEITGDFFARRFSIIKNGKCVASVSKKLLSLGDCYEIDIEDEKDETKAIAIVIIIDFIRESREVGGG